VVAVLRYDALAEVREIVGAQVADALLREGAASLQTQVRRSDTLARLGPDGFALVLEDASSRANSDRLVAALADALLRIRVRQPGLELVGVAPSVGLSVYPDEGGGAAELLAAAEAQRQRARRTGALH